MKRILLFLLCSSPLLLNAMTEVKVKQTNLDIVETQLKEDILQAYVMEDEILLAADLLAEFSFDQNTLNKSLALAFGTAREDMVKLLISRGADFNEIELDTLNFKGIDKLAMLRAIHAGKKNRQLDEKQKNVTKEQKIEPQEKKESGLPLSDDLPPVITRRTCRTTE